MEQIESAGSPSPVEARATSREQSRWASLDEALGAARRGLLALQREDGHWCGELEGDSILESEYILLMYFLGRAGEERVAKAANYLRREQLPQGGWAVFPGGDAEVSATVKGYFALKLMGDAPSAEHMLRARRAAERLGGMRACNSYTKLYLAIFGQYPWKYCPAVPPEMILLPNWLPFNIYAMSSWSRAIVVPLAMIWAYKPHCEVPDQAAIPELDIEGSARHRAPASTPAEQAWVTFFEAVDIGLKWVEGLKLRPFRRLALKRCEEWILARLAKSDGLGAIIPPIINTIVAFRCHGYDPDHPVLAAQLEEIDKLEIVEGDTLRIQPCKSPVWDTSQAISALRDAGLPGDDPALVSAAEWLLDHEVRAGGDWKLLNPEVPIGGWYFEYANEFYPDCDDTAEVMTALAKLEPPAGSLERRSRQALERAAAWLIGMQNDDGGWAAFDRGCDREVLTYIPFADHNAMIDPSTVDITGRALEALASCGFASDHPAVRRGIGFVLEQQEPDGSWYGRWGANYIYGTWLALSGLAAARFDMRHPACRRAVDWLLACQNPDGGWGESLRSYEDPDWRGRGATTTSQTAWALLGLIAAGEASSEAVRRGVECLLERQQEDGTWYDQAWTGTGFPRVFYLRYHYYSTYFPLQALAVYRRSVVSDDAGERVA
ncbi:MAG: squalene--hopene cyclase [Thermoanaerobaculia bacterium]|nr:squalene--hopene cyclase [Thermoanaerobaculia bacterium]